MDKKEYKICVEEIQKLIKRKKYTEAARIADKVDWRNVQNTSMLCTISDLYKVNRRFDDAMQVLLLAFDKYPRGRMIVYSLCELSLLRDDVVSAKAYYNEFIDIVPRDSGRYILEYKLYVAIGASLEEQITVLQEFKKRDYREKWGYELAYLYHRVGLATECVQECDELFLWFQEGKYVTKALELKMLHEPLSPEQQKKYKGNKRPSVNTIVQGLSDDDISIEVKPVNVGKYATINLQKELAENLQPYIDGGAEVVGEPTPAEDTNEVNLVQTYTDGFTDGLGYSEDVGEFTREIIDSYLNPGQATNEIIEVAPGYVSVNMGYDESGQPIYTEPIPIEQLNAQDYYVQENNVVNGNPVFATDNYVTEYSQEYYPQNFSQENAFQPDNMAIAMETQEEPIVEEYEVQTAAPMTPMEAEEQRIKEKAAKLAPISTPKIVKMNTGKLPKVHQTEKMVPIGIVPPTATDMAKVSAGEEIDDMLSQDTDGQLSLVIPPMPEITTQITGQMDIKAIAEGWSNHWEDVKKSQSEDHHERMKRTTDDLFAEFDEATKNDVLHQMERLAEASIAKEKKRSISPIQAQERLAEEARKQKEEMAAAQKAEEEAEQKAKEAAELLAQMEAKEAAEAVLAEALKKEKLEADTSDLDISENIKDNDESEVTSEEVKDVASTDETTADVDVNQKENEAEVKDTTEVDTENKVVEEKEEKSEKIEASDSEKDLNPVESKEAEEIKAESEPVTVDENREEATIESEEGKEKEINNKSESSEEKHEPKEARNMTSEEKRVFGSFIQTKATKDQIVNCIDNMSLASYTGNVIVTGERGMGSGKLAKTLLKEMHLTDANFSNKVAKMTGLSMNGKDMDELLDKLNNGALLIEKAGNMKEGAIRNLLKALDTEKRGVVVVLEDTKIAMNKMINANSDLEKFFNIRVDIEALDNDALVSYAKKYAESREYAIDELGVLAMYERIAESQTSDHAVTTRDVQDMVEDSIRHANRKNISHFMDVLLGKRYDTEDMIILREKHVSAY